LALAVGDVLRGKLVHHRFPDLVAGAAPDIHDLVVTLAHCDEARVYWVSISFTSPSAAVMRSCFCVGTSMSSTQIEIPARVAIVNPACMSLSAKITVSRSPQRRNDALMSLEISFFLERLVDQFKG